MWILKIWNFPARFFRFVIAIVIVHRCFSLEQKDSTLTVVFFSKMYENPVKFLQLAVSTASGNEESVSTPVYLAILKGLERLLLTDVLSQQDAEAIVKLGVDRLE